MTAALLAVVGLGIAANAVRRVARVRVCSRTKDTRRVAAQYAEWVVSTGLLVTAAGTRFHLSPVGAAISALGVATALVVVVNGAYAISHRRS